MQIQMLLRVCIQAEKTFRETCKWDLDTFFLLIQGCLQHVGAACREWCLPGLGPPLQKEGKQEEQVRPGLHGAAPCTESWAGNWLFLKSAQALLLFQRNCIGSSTRQKAGAANGELKHRGKSWSLHCRVRFTVLLFLPQEDWDILHMS